MAADMTTDLEAIAELTRRQRAVAESMRGLGADAPLAGIVTALRGSALADACSEATDQINRALTTVAMRIEAAATANTTSANTVDAVDRDHAARIGALVP